MGTAHSDDLRLRVVEEILAGASRRQAERFKVSAASAVRWVQLHSQTGGVQPRRRGGKSRSPLEPHAAWLLELISAEPDLTLEAIAALLAGPGLKTSKPRFVVSSNATRLPSKRCTPPSVTGPTSLRRASFEGQPGKP